MKKIGRLEVENDFSRSVSKACGIESRKAQTEEKHPHLSVNRQLQLLKVPRSSYYYKSQKKTSKVASDERAKDEIMDIFYDTPFYGIPRLTAELKRRGFNINHKRVRRLQKVLGLRTIYLRVRISILPPPIRNTKSFPTSCRAWK